MNKQSEYQKQLRKIIKNHVYCSVSELMTQLYNGATTNEDFADVMYTYTDDYDSDGGKPEYQEALQHWSVSPYLGNKLKQQGEMVSDVYGLTVWGRTTTGQSIYMDYAIQQAFPNGDDNENEQHESKW
jgi:hypothetical protein